jgi:hypothetical protein
MCLVTNSARAALVAAKAGKGTKVPELTSTQFDLLARLLQSKEPARAGARLVLVEGKSNPEAYALAGISPQSLSNTLGRYRKAHVDICKAYGID